MTARVLPTELLSSGFARICARVLPNVRPRSPENGPAFSRTCVGARTGIRAPEVSGRQAEARFGSFHPGRGKWQV